MANYTMTIAEMMCDKLTQDIFPSDYEFYVDDEKARKSFEDKFIKHYYYREIGFESPFMFTQKLESHLLLNMPYWKQLYQTELEARDINFLLNKDLKETFIREIESENQTSGTNTTQQNATSSNTVSQTGNSTNTSSTTQEGTSSTENSLTQNGTSSNTHKESSISDGVAVSSLTEGYLTGTSSDDGTTSNTESSTSSGENTSKITSTSSDEMESTGTASGSNDVETTGTTKQTDNGTSTERTELLSQGNIGITSSAQLLKEWREVLINMDKIIIESCNDLFMKIY